MAIKFGWTGRVTTGLAFSEFYHNKHTVAFRFMPQYPHSYAGAALTDDESGGFRYFIGQGQYDGGAHKPGFITQLGNQRADYATELKPNVWARIAVVRDATEVRTYLDGAELLPRLPVPTADAPTGTLVLGRNSVWQLYGLLDDVLIFTKALSVSEVKGLMTTPLPSATTTGLLAGWSFPVTLAPGTPQKFSRSFQLHGAAELVDTSATQSSAQDSKLLGPPKLQAPIHLPFPTGEEWFVHHGFDERNGPSHWFLASFCWDMTRVNPPVRGAPIYAAAAGVVDDVKADSPSGPLPSGVSGNFVNVEHAPGEVFGYGHFLQNTATVKKGDFVDLGQKLGETGDTGASEDGPGNDHVHIGASHIYNGGASFVTIPSAFRDYDVSTDDGKSWQYVALGIPKPGERIRSRAKWHGWYDLDGKIKGAPAVVLPTPTTVDIYVWGDDDRLWQRWWDGSAWSDWLPHEDGGFRLGSAPAVVCSGPNHRDVYVRGFDAKVYHKHWNGTKWSQWFGLNGEIKGAPSVVMITATSWDIYVRGMNDRLWQKSWTGFAWQPSDLGWSEHVDGNFLLGSAPRAVCNHPNNRDVFARGQNGAVFHKTWNAGKWSPWFGLGGEIKDAPAVAFTSQTEQDIYVRGKDDRLWQKWWTGSAWMPSDDGWSLHDDGGFRLGSAPTLVSRGSWQRDVYVRGQDGRVYHKFWC